MKALAPSFLSCAFFSVASSGRAANAPVAQFPFQRDGQLMFLDVRINGAAPARFVVDSGAPHTVFDPKFARELGLKIEKTAAVIGTGKGAVTTAKTAPCVMTIGDLKVQLPEPWVIDLSKVPIPATTKGLIGAELFQQFVVRIDPRAQTFSIFDPATFRYDGKGTSLPLTVERGKLYLTANLEVPAGTIAKHQLRIDTGSESSVDDEIVKHSAEVRKSSLGNGLGQNFEAISGVFTSVKLGPYAIQHVWGPGGPGPSVGMEILRRFVLTFDVPRNRLYLEPTAALAEPVPTPN